MFNIKKTDLIHSYLQEHRQIPLSSLEREFRIDKEEMSKHILELIKDNKVKIKNKMVPMIKVTRKPKNNPQKDLSDFLGRRKHPVKIRKSKVYPLIREQLKPKKDIIEPTPNGELNNLKKEINDLKSIMQYNSLIKNIVKVQKENKAEQKQEFTHKKDMPFHTRRTFSQDPGVERQVKKLLKNVGFA